MRLFASIFLLSLFASGCGPDTPEAVAPEATIDGFGGIRAAAAGK